MAKVGDVFKVFTNTITIKVAGADNDGTKKFPPKIGVPKHVHRGAAETLFVLDGHFNIFVAGEIRELYSGDGIYLPADIPHGDICRKFRTPPSLLCHDERSWYSSPISSKQRP
jgi:quercetin dioxygenase-like cupin family protein